MTKFILSASVLAIAAVVGGAAQAQDLEYWGEAGGWDVMIDPSLGYGCLIQAAYQDGSIVRIGFDRNEGAGYVTAFNDAWAGIEEGEIYPVTFELDGESYDGEATGIYLSGVPGADIYFTNPDFLFDLAQRYTMTLYNDNGEVMAIDLDGSYVGLEAVLECQDEMG